MKKLGTVAITVLTVLPLLALAQTGVGTPPSGVPGGQVQFVEGGFNTVVNIINKLSLWLLYGLLVIAGVFIVYAAYLYLTAAGDPEKVKSASTVIIYAVVAIGVGLLSRVIVAIARALVGGGGGQA